MDELLIKFQGLSEEELKKELLERNKILSQGNLIANIDVIIEETEVLKYLLNASVNNG